MLRILVVDDWPDTIDSYRDLLELEGHQVLAVENGELALGQVVAFQPQAVILDIGLPRMDGYEVARRLRQLLAPLTIIVVSGFGTAEDQRRAHEAGCDHFLIKPADFEALLRLLPSPSGDTQR